MSGARSRHDAPPHTCLLTKAFRIFDTSLTIVLRISCLQIIASCFTRVRIRHETSQSTTEEIRRDVWQSKRRGRMLRRDRTAGLSSAATVDILVTVSLVVILQRSRTGYSTRSASRSISYDLRFNFYITHSTDHIIDSIALYTIETGMITW